VTDAGGSVDPGWPSFRAILRGFLPGIALIQMGRLPKNRNGLLQLRATLVYLTVALVIFGCVLTVIVPTKHTHVMPWIAILAGVVIYSVAGVTWGMRKPLPCDTLTALAGGYRARFFLVIAFSESVALFGLVFTFLGAPVWIYYLAAVFTIVRVWTVAPPTRAAIARDQQALTNRGCGLLLLDALQPHGID